MEKREIYKDNFAEYLLCLSLDVGEGMLRCGAEISRVEDTIERICKAYGAVHVEVFSIISFINAAIRMPDGSYSSQMRRIRSISTDLTLLERYNALSRRMCAERPSLSDFDGQIREIKSAKKFGFSLICLACGVASGGFAMFFGGRWNDVLIAFLIGMLIGVVDMRMPSRVNAMAKTVISSAITAAVAILCARLGLASSADYVIMGAIMLLVPGVCFGTAMRDLLYGDLLAGTLKTLQAILTALMIAFGYMISVEFLELFGVALDTGTIAPIDFEIFFKPFFFVASLGALLGSLGFAVMF
ncbi:MAG: threonine/serine exporter family protein, partial [Clostridia bacterium]|nr:threonine/serine exporter family protein [Clostridia bacterium]